MLITLETQAADVVNQIISITASVSQLAQQIASVSTQWTNLSVANMVNAFPTAPALTTGALGTADGTPNVAHPIDVRTTDGALISRAISANDIAGMLTFLQGVQSVVNGSAVSANGAAASLIAKAK